jgi:hypothetical protein
MNDIAKQTGIQGIGNLAQQRIEAHADEARAYLDNAPRMLALVRQRIIEVDTRYRSARAHLTHRFDDDIARLEAERGKDIARLSEMQRRIQALQETR